MSEGRLTRRTLLRGLAVGGAASTMGAGTAGGTAQDRYIVGTEGPEGAAAVKRRADEVHHELEFGDIGNAVAGRFPQEALEAMARRRDVRYIEPDARMRALGETLEWGVDRVDADLLHDDGVTGEGADIAILDTGIDPDHSDLEANLGTGKAYYDCGTEVDGSSCSTSADCTVAWADDNDHGTHCAGIAAAVDNTEDVIGVAPDATLHAVKVLDCTGWGYYSEMAAALEYVTDQGWDVASMSLGGTSSSSTLQDACQYAADNGVLVVAAAGNSGPCTDCVKYPAVYDSVIAVSATDYYDSLADFSSTGPEIELAAPGEYIESTVPGGETESWSGTSMACPHVSGAAGLLMANGHTAGEARSRLQSTAEDVGLADNEQGYGLLDAEAAMGTTTSALAVSTDGTSSVTATGATLEGTLSDLGGASSADVAFDYREQGTSTWTTTSAGTLSSTGGFSESIGGLGEEVTYEVRAVADASDGDSDTGGEITFTTSDDPAGVSTDSPTSVGETSATLNGRLDDLGGASSADVAFEYRQTGTDTWSAASAGTLSSTGSFSADVTGLSAGTEYEYRARAEASDGDSATGTTVTLTTSGDTSVAVSTDGASSVTATRATLEGTLTDLGGASSADVAFDYREAGTSTWTTTATQTLSSTGGVSESVGGLAEQTEYEYRARAEASDGDTATGSTLTVTTTDDPVAVTTDGASDVTSDGATLTGNLTDLGGASSADVAFEYRPVGADRYTATAGSTVETTGSFSESVTGLTGGTDYEFRAVATASDGDADAGSLLGFTTDSASTGNTAPVVDSYAVTEAGSPNPHAEITADWTVSDADGDLSTVLVEVRDGSGVVASSRNSVNGGSASGTDTFRIKKARGVAFDVTITVTDGAGNTATATRTVTE